MFLGAAPATRADRLAIHVVAALFAELIFLIGVSGTGELPKLMAVNHDEAMELAALHTRHRLTERDAGMVLPPRGYFGFH